MTKAMIVVNPSSGPEQAADYIGPLKEELQCQFDEVIVKTTEKEGDISRFSQEAAQHQYEGLFLMGGGGTINKGVNAIAPFTHRPVLGVIPLGTVNNFARSIGVPMRPEEAIAQISHAREKTIDIGKVNDLYFVSTVSAGSIPESVQSVDADSKATLGPLDYLVEGLKTLADEQPILFDLSLDGKKAKEPFSLIVVALSNSVTGIETFFSDAAIDDGRLHFMGLRETSAVEKMALVPELFQQDEQYPDKLPTKPFKKAVFHTQSSEKHACTVDGDTGPSFPIEVEVLPRFLSVYSFQ